MSLIDDKILALLVAALLYAVAVIPFLAAFRWDHDHKSDWSGYFWSVPYF